ncbi:hypothetical protein ACLB2K_072255 [Fragaria x ananassa]
MMMKKIEESMSSSGVVNLTDRFITLTNDVICTIALGRKYSGGEGGKIFNEILGEFMELLGRSYIGDYIPWLAWLSSVNGLDAKLDKVAKRFDEFLDGIIQEHINRSPKNGKSDQHIDEHKDFVDVLLWIQKENMAGFPVGRVSIKALILNEVRGIVGNKREITEDDLVGMHYLQAVMKETLRLHPPVPLLMPRKATQDVKVQGYDIKANTVVIVNAWQIGSDPKSYDNPEEFEPERFLITNSDTDYKGKDFQLIPFGAGRRGCPGINFAMAVNEIALANLVHKFDWSPPDGVKPRDLDMTESCGLTKRRKYPLKAIAVSHSAD